MQAGVIVFPGSNCDRDAMDAVKRSFHKDAIAVWHKDTSLPKLDFIIVPGGFSYGDYLRSGAMAAKSPIMNEVIKAANNGVYVIGICNGFQIITEAGLLPGSLMRNKNLKFIHQTQHLRVVNNNTAFTKEYEANQHIKFSIAHGEGNYFAEKDVLEELESNNQVVFRYADKAGNINEEGNANGSTHNIAGIINKKGNVLGLMPHPERHTDALASGIDGLALFTSVINSLK